MRKMLLMLIGYLVGVICCTAQMSGTVTDSSSDPLVGVIVHNETNGGVAVTSTEGKYTISATTNDRITFKFIGKNDYSVIYTEDMDCDIQLQDQNVKMDEVVCIAYGDRTKKTLVGAVKSVDMKMLRNFTNMDNICSSIVGNVPGITYVADNFNKKGRIIVHGLSTFSGSSEPLIIIDGHMMYNQVLTEYGPEQIESISVLTDASATALYGASGANGAIIIKTKRGVGRHVVATATVGVETIQERHVYDVITDPRDYAKVLFRSLYNSYGGDFDMAYQDFSQYYFHGFHNDYGEVIDRGTLEVSDDAQLGQELYGEMYTPEYKKPYTKGRRQKYTLYAQNGRLTTYITLNNESTPLGDHQREGYAHIKDTFSPLDGMTVELQTMMGGTKLKNQNYEKYDLYLNSPANLPRTYDYAYLTMLNAPVDNYLMADMNDYGQTGMTTKNVYCLEYAKGMFSVKSSGQIIGESQNGQFFTYTQNGKYEVYDASNHSQIRTHYIYGDIEKSWGGHKLDLTLGNTMYKRAGTIDKRFGYDETKSRGVLKSTQDSKYDIANVNFISRLTYSNGVIGGEMSFTRGGSSRFMNNKFGNFWSVGMYGNLADALNLNGTFDLLKVSCAYGVSGNDQLGENRPTFDDIYAIKEGLVEMKYKGNKDLKWEKTSTFNANLDLKAGGFSATMDFYVKDTDGILVDLKTKASKGYTSMPVNLGRVMNTGFDLSMAYGAQKGDLDYNVQLTASHFKNRLKGDKEYWKGQKSMYYSYLLDDEYNVSVSDDLAPKLYGNLNLHLAYKGWQLNVNGSYQLGGKVHDMVYGRMMHTPINCYNYHKDILKHLDEVVADGVVNVYQEKFYKNSSYFLLSEANIGYTLPQALTSKIGVQGAQISMMASNPLCFTHERGLNPQYCVDVNYEAHFVTTTFALGLKITL